MTARDGQTGARESSGEMMMRRCFVCAAAMLAPTGRALTYSTGRRRTFSRACGSCGVLLAEGADPDACREHLTQHLSAPTFQPDEAAPYGLDLYTLRIAATRLGRGIRPLDAQGRAALRHPHDGQAARADLFALDGESRRPVSLGLLCRPAELDPVLAALPEAACWTDDVAILLDGPPNPPQAVPVAGFQDGTVRVASRPLDGDFAAQRNALQDLARHGWMLQLDADETLAPAVGGLLPALPRLADEGDVVSIGLARANRVDNVLSDVFPDVQYRLNRTDVRYAGRVHERPALDGGWPRSFITLHGEITHHLSGAHVRARSRRYETLDPGRGRPEEEEALLRPYAG